MNLGILTRTPERRSWPFFFNPGAPQGSFSLSLQPLGPADCALAIPSLYRYSITKRRFGNACWSTVARWGNEDLILGACPQPVALIYGPPDTPLPSMGLLAGPSDRWWWLNQGFGGERRPPWRVCQVCRVCRVCRICRVCLVCLVWPAVQG